VEGIEGDRVLSRQITLTVDKSPEGYSLVSLLALVAPTGDNFQ
jgi:hypothetical protein